ncbi:MAG: protein-disulfide reductase DsbD domain-containing protein [Planctomycetota bacterium]
MKEPRLPAGIAVALWTVLFAFGSVCPAQEAPTRETKLSVKGMESDDPFTLSAKASETRLTVAIHLRKGWHMYGRDVGGGQPVDVKILDGSCFQAAGKLAVPMDEEGRITGDAILTLPLRRTKKGTTLRASFSFMACDALMCLPPREVTLQTAAMAAAGTPQKLKVLLVTLDDAERAARIKSFLETRGFGCTVTHFKDVSKEECDRHDLVLTDSPNKDKDESRASMRAQRHALDFPETKSPIVTVGYLGTELLEAHKIAMACGYI